MKIKGLKPESLTTIIEMYYNEHKEVLDVWQELMIANQTDIEVTVPEEPEVPVVEEVSEEVRTPVEVDLKSTK